MAKTYAQCSRCKGVYPVVEMVGTISAKRGGRHEYMCQRCATINERYHATNDKILGTEKLNSVICGVEFETSYTDERARNAMFEYGFIPTHDCSLSSDSPDGSTHRYGYDGNTCEYVSGLMLGLNRPSKFAVSCEQLITDGHMTVNDSCGTHFHVSINSMKDSHGNETYMGYIRRFYHSLFVPLCRAMQANPEATTQLFGRYFNYHYASVISDYSDVHNRYNFINVVNNNNIEFRINKFVSAGQYQLLMKMEVEMVKCIIVNFCEHFNDTEIDSRRYPTMTAYRKHKADVTAKKLVAIFKKYIANI